MRRKRLQHQVDIFCQMFCGWRFSNSHEVLSTLGSGTLHIDVLTGESAHNGTRVPDLNIAGEIMAWFRSDLADNKIPVEAIRSASFVASLDIAPLEGRRRSTEIWNTKITRYTKCDINCKGRITTDERTYESQMTDHEEWPDGWWTGHRATAPTVQSTGSGPTSD